MRRIFYGLTLVVVLSLVGYSAWQATGYSNSARVREAINSVVKIRVEYVGEDPETMISTTVHYSATGFSIYRSFSAGKSYVMTNKHVCDMKGKASYKLELNNGSVVAAKYLTSDSFADLCLLEADTTIRALKLAKRNGLQGDRITTIGAPDGVFPIVLDGIICGYSEVSMKNGKDDNGEFEINFRDQVVSIPVYQGASGSPVFDTDGDVIGVVFAVRVGKEHISFIVPVSEVLRFLDRSEYVRS